MGSYSQGDWASGYNIADTIENSLMAMVMQNRQIQSAERMQNRQLVESARMFDKNFKESVRQFGKDQAIKDAREGRISEQYLGKKKFTKASNLRLADKEKMLQDVAAKTKRQRLIENEKRGLGEWWAEDVMSFLPGFETREEKAHRWSGSTPEEINILDYPDIQTYSPLGRQNASFEDILNYNPSNINALNSLMDLTY